MKHFSNNFYPELEKEFFSSLSQQEKGEYLLNMAAAYKHHLFIESPLQTRT